jgi:hypothetical protein
MEQQLISQTGELETTRQQLATALTTLNDLQREAESNGSSTSLSLSTKKKNKQDRPSGRKQKTSVTEEGEQEKEKEQESGTTITRVSEGEVEALKDKLEKLQKDLEERLFFEETIYASELVFEPLDPGQT